MNGYEICFLAKSMAGHDLGRLYLVIAEDPACVYLADGKIRTMDRPKKKKRKHVQLIYHIPEQLRETMKSCRNDSDIRKVIRQYTLEG